MRGRTVFVLGILATFFWWFGREDRLTLQAVQGTDRAPASVALAKKASHHRPIANDVAPKTESSMDQTLTDIQSRSLKPWHVVRDGGYLRYMSGGRLRGTGDPEQFLREHASSLFGVPYGELRPSGHVDGERISYRYEQVRAGILIYSKSLVLEYEDGDLVGVQNELEPRALEAEMLSRNVSLDQACGMRGWTCGNSQAVHFYSRHALHPAFLVVTQDETKVGHRRRFILSAVDGSVIRELRNDID